MQKENLKPSFQAIPNSWLISKTQCLYPTTKKVLNSNCELERVIREGLPLQKKNSEKVTVKVLVGQGALQFEKLQR